MMKDITFTIKVITPTLMGGGFGQNDGIRPSEIKGLMRYWFRAVAGSFIIHFPETKFKQDLENLKRFEGDIFGNTIKKSSFRLIIRNTNEKLQTKKLSHLPHKNWSKKNPLEIVSADNSVFTLEILIRKIPFKETSLEEYKNFLKNLLKLSFFFGIGFRKNRFFGNMILGNEEMENIEDLINKVKNFVSKSFKIYGDVYKTEKKKTLLPLFPTFSYRSEKEKNYYIIKAKDDCSVKDWEKFLENFYKEIIHKIERNTNLKFFIDHKYSLINFSYINGKIYLSSFFHKNNGYLNNLRKYNNWKSGLNEIKKLINSSRLCENEK